MASPTFARLSHQTSRYLQRVQKRAQELIHSTTPPTHSFELSPFAKRSASRKQLFKSPSSRDQLRGQITFCSHIFNNSKVKANSDLLTPPRNSGNSVPVKEGESPNVGYEITSPFLQMLYRRKQPTDVQLLGRGTFGSVYFALQEGECRALKVAEKGQLKGEKNALNLHHLNIASVLYLWSAHHDGTASVAIMEYGGSLSLHKLLLKQDFNLSSNAKTSVCVQVARALDYCHKHMLVHLDVKPANILVSTSTGICKLADFGCSLLLKELKSKKKESVRMQCSKRCALVGTVAYVAPELFHGQDPSTAADIYSLGMVLYQLETKKIPFEGLHPHTLIYRVVSMKERPSIPCTPNYSWYWKIVNACWHPEPKHRPPAKDILYKMQQ